MDGNAFPKGKGFYHSRDFGVYKAAGQNSQSCSSLVCGQGEVFRKRPWQYLFFSQATTALIGNNDLKFGIGDSRLTLMGNQSDYKFDIKNSIGTININNNSVSVGSIGNGNNNIKINGGIGTINISFQE